VDTGPDRRDALVSKKIYLEGGGDSKELCARCREGFRKLIENCNIARKLAKATRDCTNAYMKNKRSFEVLGKLTPDELEKYLPSFKRVRRILKKKL
jgi:ribonuclease HII